MDYYCSYVPRTCVIKDLQDTIQARKKAIEVMQGSDWTTSGPPSSHGPSQDSAASVPLIPYLRQQKEVHEREQIRLGLAPLPPYILQQFTPSEIIHNYLMQMDSFVTIKEWHSRFCKAPAFMKVRVGIIQVKK